MAEKRKSDVTARSQFRTDRMFVEAGQWYFHTREGTIEGPFRDMVEAQNRLDSYIKLTNSGLAPSEGKFSLAELEVG